MFTGVITATARIIAINSTEYNYLISVDYSNDDMHEGESIALDGVCMNVAGHNEQGVIFLLSHAAFKRANFTVNKLVNIERAIDAINEERGHFITGKIDQLATIKYSKIAKNTVEITVGDINKDHLQQLFPKCAIAINGVSLTIANISDNTLAIKISPKIITRTNLKLLRPEDTIHVEYCIVAKNVKKDTVYNLEYISSVN